MKILLLHSDFIEWEPKKKAIKAAEEIEKKLYRAEEALVVFSAVEKADEKDPANVIKNALVEIEQVFKEVHAKTVVIYPYVHLSPSPSKPDTALKVLIGIESELGKKKYEVYRAPFGWYKGFNIKVKGHPLSELSRQIGSEGKDKENVSEAVKKEEKLRSKWYVFTPDGNKHEISLKDGRIHGFDASKHEKFGKLLMYEMAKNRTVDREPPHVELMRRLELVDYEGASDPGSFRFYPKGRLIKSLLEQFTTKKMIDYGAMEVETPLMYDYEHPSLKSYMNRFPARQYTIETPNKRVFLRFAACFGSFIMMHDASISYRNLPLRPYELTRYSFRVEQRGELAGLRRLRAFTMPDCHALCADIEQAKKEFLKRFDAAKEIQNGIGLEFDKDFEFSIRVVKDFYEKNSNFIHDVVRKMGKPVLVEMWEDKFFYFVFKMEWNFIDALDKAACLTTDQFDVENGERYGIVYTDKDNIQKHPIILHLSPTGSIERVIYALLEKYYMQMKQGKNPVFPMWLSPTQVRIIPVSEKFVKDAMKIAEDMQMDGIRADVDDRNDTVQKKIMNAEKSWTPLIVVVGERELKEKKLAVRYRVTGKVEKKSAKELAKEIHGQTEGFPFMKLSLPTELSKRPVFYG